MLHGKAKLEDSKDMRHHPLMFNSFVFNNNLNNSF